MYKIDKDVPAPTVRAGAAPKYPWRELDVGDSFFVSLDDAPATIKTISPPVGLATTGYKVIRRSVTEDGVDGVRFWRVA